MKSKRSIIRRSLMAKRKVRKTKAHKTKTRKTTKHRAKKTSKKASSARRAKKTSSHRKTKKAHSARRTKRTSAKREELLMNKKAHWEAYKHLQKRCDQAWNKLKADVKRKAAPEILIKDKNHLLLLLGECNYMASECMRFSKRKKS